MTDNNWKALREAKAYLAVNGPSSQAASILARLVAEMEAAPVVDVVYSGGNVGANEVYGYIDAATLGPFVRQRVRVVAVGEDG